MPNAIDKVAMIRKGKRYSLVATMPSKFKRYSHFHIPVKDRQGEGMYEFTVSVSRKRGESTATLNKRLKAKHKKFVKCITRCVDKSGREATTKLAFACYRRCR